MRLELIHPMLVHFPIALLSTGVILRFIAIWTAKREKFSFILPASWLILTLGVIAAWLTVLAGGIAADIVAPSLENTDLLNHHATLAYRTAIGFTIGLFVDLFRAFLWSYWQKKNWFVRKGLAIVFSLLYLFSLTNLIITGDYGATLVYEEGAAIEKKTE